MIKHQNNVAIMQPHFFPRAAYFKLILKSDTFVVLNNVPFERQSWQSRNRILTKNGILYINLPTVKSKLGTEIQNILVKPFNNWLPKLERTLRQNYAKSFFKDDFKILMNEIFNQNFLSTPGAIFLADFNIKIIHS